MPTLLLLRNYNLSEEEVQKLPKGCRGTLMVPKKSTVIARADVPTYMSLSHVISLATAMSRAIPNAQVEYSERTLSGAKMITLPDASWLVQQSSNIPKDYQISSNLEQLPDEKLHEPVSDSEPKKAQQNQTSDTEIEDAVFNSGSYVSVEDVTPTELKEYPMDVLEIDGSEVLDAEIVDVEEESIPNPEGFLQPQNKHDSSTKSTKMTWWEMLDAGLARQAYEKIVSSQLSIEEKGKLQFYFSNPDPNILICLCRVAIAIELKSLVMPISRKCFIHEHPQVRKEAVLAVGQLSGPSMESAIRRMMKDSDQDVQQAAKRALELLKSR